MRKRFWIEAGLAMSSAALCLVTLVWPDWLELLFGVDPDRGSGAVEWSIVLVCALTWAWTSVLAARDWRGAREA